MPRKAAPAATVEPSESVSTTEEPISSQEPASQPSFSELAAESTPETPETAAPAPSTYSDWRERVVQSGLNLPEDETQALEALRQFAQQTYQAQQELQQLRQYAPYGQQVAPVWNEFQQFMAQRQQAAQQPAAPAVKKSYWPKPPNDWNPAMEKFLMLDDAGNIVSKPGALPDLPQKRAAYQAWEQEQSARLLNDPAEAIWGGLEERIQQQVDQRVQAALQQYDANQQAAQYVQQNAEWLYGTDPNTGQAYLKPEGELLGQHLMYASQIGVADPYHRRTVAQGLLERDFLRQQVAQLRQQLGQPGGAAQQPAAQPPHPNKPVNRIANRGGTVNAAAAQPNLPQNGLQAIKRMLYDQAIIDGANGDYS